MFNIDIGSLAAGVLTSTFVVAIGFKIAGAKLPRIVVDGVHKLVKAIGESQWVRNPAKPKRARWWAATLELFEDEIPEPGQGRAFYMDLATEWVVFLREHLPLWLQWLVQTTDRWAGLFEPIGDALDTELDEDLKVLAAAPAAPQLPPPAV